jgi:hypothetical protein
LYRSVLNLLNSNLKPAIAAAFIALLCLAAYAPSLSIPLLEDDYGNIAQAQVYGPPRALGELMRDSVFRLRATSYWAMDAAWANFGLSPRGYHLLSLALHIANSLLVLALFSAWGGSPVAGLCAAVFFAVYEGHQEAVMWFSAINELFMFLFGVASLLCWRKADTSSRPMPWNIASAVLFALAILSKESAAIMLPLFGIAAAARTPRDWKRALLRLLPHFALAAAAAVSILQSRSRSFRFADGSFSLAAPFWITWPRGMGRLLWIWGWLALMVVIATRDGRRRLAVLLALAWMAVALVPYIFLTYSTQIPSRQTYLASAGLAILIGLAAARITEVRAAWLKAGAAIAVIILVANIGYLWTRKRIQYLERAEPTEQLIRLAKTVPGPIWVRCFPRTPYIADTAVQIGAGRPLGTLIWDEAEAQRRGAQAVFCYQERR